MQIVVCDSPTPSNSPSRAERDDAHLVVGGEVSRHPAVIYLTRLGPRSRRVMRGCLDKTARLLTSGQHDAMSVDWAAVRYQHAMALRTLLAEQLAPATANQHLSALRGVLREAWRLGLLDGESYQRAIDLPRVRGETLPAGREITVGELRAIMVACTSARTNAGARDAAIVAVAYGAGLRRSEIAGLDLDDLDRATGELRVRHGKGGKQRVTYLAGGGLQAVADWVAVRGNEAGPLLCPITRAGGVMVRRLSPQAVYDALRRRARQAGVKKVSPHDFRRTFVSHLLEAGADIATVRRLAGHADVSTTARYDRRGEAAKRKAVGLLHVPYDPAE